MTKTIIQTLFLILTGLLNANPNTIVRQSLDTLEISIKLFTPQRFEQPQLTYDYISAPQSEFLFSTLETETRFEILSQEKKPILQSRPLKVVTDLSLIPGANQPIESQRETVVQIHWLKQDKTGRHIFQVLLFPITSGKKETELFSIESMQLRLIGKDVLPFSETGQDGSKGNIGKAAARDKLSFTSDPRQIQANLSRKKRLKIWIEEEDLYRLPYSNLIKAGFDISESDPGYLSLIGPYGEVPVRILGEADGRFDEGDQIEFWGEPFWEIQENGEKRLFPFSQASVYWLEKTDRPGLRMGQEFVLPSDNPTVRPASRSFLFRQHFETDIHFNRLPGILGLNEGDHWFMMAPVIGGEKRDIPFTIRNLDEFSIQLADLKLHFRGKSINNNPQPVEVYINDRLVIPEFELRNEKRTLSSNGFSPMFLKEDENVLTVINRSTEQEQSQIILDWFELSYPKRYIAEENRLKFFPPAYSTGKTVLFDIQDLSTDQIDIYKMGNSFLLQPQITDYQDTLGTTWYRARFEDKILSGEDAYFLIAQSQKRVPDSLVTVVTPDLRSVDLNADYVVIVPHDSLGGTLLSPLLALRKKQGLRCAVVPLDTLYDNFTSGIPDPIAIQRFLKHGYDHWQIKPRFCLLIGDGYYMPRQKLQNNLMPFYHFQTYKFGAAASDHFYTLLTGEDHFPDLAVGRLPVQNKNELLTIIDKIVAYESSPPAPWKNSYLLIGSDRQTGIFGSQSEALIKDVLPKQLSPSRLYLQGDLSNPHVGGTEDLLRHLERGVGLVNFRGHGGGAIWADAGLLDLDDIELIENRGRLPVMTSITCFTADFASSRRSLGEDLLCHEETGAIGFLGASGVGWVYNDYYMLRDIYSLLTSRPDLTIGELIQFGKTNFLTKNQGSTAISGAYQYNYLGDPALRLTFPEKTLTIHTESQSISPENTLFITGMDNLEEGQIRFETVTSTGEIVETFERSVFSNPFDTDLLLSSTEQVRGLRAYAWNEATQYQASGYVPLRFGQVFFDSVFTIPAAPVAKDTLYFGAAFQSHSLVRNVRCDLLSVMSDSLLDSLSMKIGLNNIWITQSGLTGLNRGDAFRFVVHVWDEHQKLTSSDTLLVRLPTAPDLSVTELSLGGVQSTQLRAVIRNFGGEPVEGVPVAVHSEDGLFSASTRIDVTGFGTHEVYFDYAPEPGGFLLSVTVNGDSSVDELIFSNNRISSFLNIDHFNISTETGSSSWIGFPGRFECFVPGGAVSQKGVLRIRQPEADLPGIAVDSAAVFYNVSFTGNSEPVLNRPMLFRMFFSSGDTLRTGKPYRKDKQSDRWIFMEASNQDSLLMFESRQTGLFALQSPGEMEAPHVEIEVLDQPFFDMSYVPKEATFSVIITDDSGVDDRSGRIVIALDDNPVPESAWIQSDSTLSIRRKLIGFKTNLFSGNHQITVSAADIHGNFHKTDPLHFQVDEVFSLQFLGNHPNPFKRETIFTYVLTDVAESFSLKIYTVSGRLIRVFDSPDLYLPDYHEILWDGTDEWGDEVANGVYFYRFKTAQGDRVDEFTGKAAKVR